MIEPAGTAVPVGDRSPATPAGRMRRWTTSVADSAREHRIALLGGVASVLSAIALFTRFSLNGTLSRDESIYVYGAIRFSHGVPPYVSIFDPKTPGTTFLGGIAAGVARLAGYAPLRMIRVEFFVLSVLTVLAVYLLALRLFGSVAGALIAGIAFGCYTKFAQDALGGPEAKTPAVLFMVICMYLLVGRRWFAAGVFAGLAFLIWQPLLWFPLISVAAAATGAEAGRRRRSALHAAGGVAFPIVVVAIYFAVAGAFSAFVNAAFVYPLTGTVRPPETFGQHIKRIVKVIDQFKITGVVFWVGSVCLAALIVLQFVRHRGEIRSALTSPIVLIVGVTYLLNLLYALYDFQRAPDTLPFLPYPVIGVAGVVAVLQARANRPAMLRAVTAIAVVVALAVATFAFTRFGTSRKDQRGLLGQLRAACGIHRVLGTGRFVELGNPTMLVLTRRTSASNYIYLEAGVDRWKVDHTPGGLAGWGREILAQNPSLIAIDGWYEPDAKAMREFLRGAGFVRRYIGPWQVWVTYAARARATEQNVSLSLRRGRVPLNLQFHRLPARVPCAYHPEST